MNKKVFTGTEISKIQSKMTPVFVKLKSLTIADIKEIQNKIKYPVSF